MAWTTSKMFRQWWADLVVGTIANTGSPSSSLTVASALKAALYDNSITPDGDTVAASSAYSAGVWVATGGQTGTAQVFHTGQWAQAGVVLPATAVTVVAGGIIQFTSGNIVSGAAATMSNIYGMQLYIDALVTPVAKQGLGFWYFGGTAFAVTAGTLTISANASGLFRLTV